MGGVSNAHQNDSLGPYYINAFNPASHAHYRLTVFDVGVMNQLTKLQTNSKELLTNRTALSHIAFAFPVKKWWGASFGMMPYSSVGYKISTSAKVDSIGDVHYTYEGSGGLNEIFLGNGFRYKNFSFGVNLSYLFGSLRTVSRDSFPGLSSSYSTKVLQIKRFNDIYFKGGMQYRFRLKNTWTAVAGITASLQTYLNAKETYLAENYRYRFGLEQVRDTIKYAPDQAQKILLPGIYGFGLSFRKGDKWLITADYTLQNWSSFDAFGQKGLLANSNRVSAGMQYWPGRTLAKAKYYKRVAYRAGLRFANTYLLLGNNTPLTDMTFTLGLGMPLRITKVGENYNQAMLNLAVELGQRGTVENALIKENYVRVVLGFSINEKWFIQRKYD